MTELNLCTKNNLLHHAYCILGDKKDVGVELEKFFLKELNFSIKNNPDFWRGDFDVLDIEDGRAIKNLHQNRPISGDKKIFVINANFITEKAQNAMLKLFEEPRGDTHFFLIIPSLNNIIPTFRSRLFVVNTNDASSSIIDPKQFIKIPIGKRMEEVKKICESISDEEKSKIEIIKFINAIEVEFFLRQSAFSLRKSAHFLEDIEKMRQYAGEQSPSLKMLLEHLSLILPVN